MVVPRAQIADYLAAIAQPARRPALRSSAAGTPPKVVVCDPGDEAVAPLTQFARAERLEAAKITAVGAFERATVGWFDPAARDYRRIQLDQQCPLLSLLGDVAEGQDGPILHMHVVLGLSDGTRVNCHHGGLAATRVRL